jgi:hypothetical protein
MIIYILRNEKIDIDYVENPEGLDFVDIIVRDQGNSKITRWHSLSKEQVQEVIEQLQEALKYL